MAKNKTPLQRDMAIHNGDKLDRQDAFEEGTACVSDLEDVDTELGKLAGRVADRKQVVQIETARELLKRVVAKLMALNEV